MNGSVLLENKTPYRVEGETGRFEFTTYSSSNIDGSVFNTARDFFDPLNGRERYRTRGFNGIALFDCCTECSYRNSQKIINRIRHQQDEGTSVKTLEYYAGNEAAEIEECVSNKTEEILKKHNVDQEEIASDTTETEEFTFDKTSLWQALAELDLEKEPFTEEQLLANPVVYENPENTVNISMDDICVKKQKETRKNDTETKQSSRVYNTVTHIQYAEKSYVLASRSVMIALRTTLAFLFHNGLGKLNLLFFTDGQKSLKSSILDYFSFKNAGLILDWYHLDKKCKELLSMAMKNRTIRNETLEVLTRYLWFGLLDEASAFLDSLPSENIRNKEQIDKLKNYFERNRKHIPCYALREKLGLRNSSNIGEKMNDVIIASRQKHNGMSWSVKGSKSLALLKCIKQNNEIEQWLDKKDITFKLAS